jgi:hypothetical protein
MAGALIGLNLLEKRNGGKSKAVTYAFPPGYRENAEEED